MMNQWISRNNFTYSYIGPAYFLFAYQDPTKSSAKLYTLFTLTRYHKHSYLKIMQNLPPSILAHTYCDVTHLAL